ncbi:unnamed protein product [Prunus armeniaca]|uniref:Uncharacterized protein n=1 Tax=Prunus armeniaca TaxID=36596 RepID=A0A6J5TEH4_PRUAR|nr:unnamed protein product [Prunus armeniaca]CAB4292337.1 unnamed protein product [Prunus armeniaca]
MLPSSASSSPSSSSATSYLPLSPPNPLQPLPPSSMPRQISSLASRSHSGLSGFKSRTSDHSRSPLRRLLPLHLGPPSLPPYLSHQLPLAWAHDPQPLFLD